MSAIDTINHAYIGSIGNIHELHWPLQNLECDDSNYVFTPKHLILGSGPGGPSHYMLGFDINYSVAYYLYHVNEIIQNKDPSYLLKIVNLCSIDKDGLDFFINKNPFSNEEFIENLKNFTEKYANDLDILINEYTEFDNLSYHYYYDLVNHFKSESLVNTLNEPKYFENFLALNIGEYVLFNCPELISFSKEDIEFALPPKHYTEKKVRIFPFVLGNIKTYIASGIYSCGRLGNGFESFNYWNEVDRNHAFEIFNVNNMNELIEKVQNNV